MELTCRRIVTALGLFVLAALGPASSAQQAPDRVAAIKQWLAQSKAQLKQYQWIETTVVSRKGEEKSREVSTCYYDVTGEVQQVPVTAPPEEEKKRGLRGMIIEKKKEEMTEYMKDAVGLVKSYVPPTPEKIQASKDAGKMSIDVLPGGTNVKVSFHDYGRVGDNLSITMDPATNHILGISVATYIDDPKGVVLLDVSVSALPDGTGYPSQIVLDAKAEDLIVTVTKTGCRKAQL